MTQPEVSLDGDCQRHEDRPGHGDVRHRMHEVRKDVSVRIRRNEKSSIEDQYNNKYESWIVLYQVLNYI
jgi:hypothetical protein